MTGEATQEPESLRVAAAQGLANHESPDARLVLQECVDDESDAVRDAVLQALERRALRQEANR